ncbi:hypothetical protein [Streptosporangium sp. KLBMP 9127]|nr:hypothetical protein [Streptosporangium sp. KLBMP 9127]
MAPESVSGNAWETSPEARGHPLAEHLVITRADHSQPPSHNVMIGHCARAFADLSGPHCLAHFERGFRDFTVDVLDDPRVSGRGAGPADREAYARSFRQFILGTERSGRALDALQSGELMRTVLETPDGAVHCGRVRPGQYVVGSVTGVESVDVMDERISFLVSDLRVKVYRLSDQDPGGYHQVVAVGGGDRVYSHRKGAAPRDVRLELLRALFESHLSLDDLHYVALYQGWRFAGSTDLFDSENLGPWFYGISANRRRDLYEGISQYLRAELAQLGRAVQRLIGGPPRRLVLDVEAGAVYLHFLGGDGDFLLGVTLDQSAVFTAEQRLRKIVGSVRELLQQN